jgi:serine O-acetyltransferase
MTKNELKSLLEEERALYLGEGRKKQSKKRLTNHKRYCIWRALHDFRLAQYYSYVRTDPGTSLLRRRHAKFASLYYDRKRNRSGAFAGVEIGINSSVGRCVNIWHGGIVINGTLGDGCILHGNNIIGNKGSGLKNETPVIGAGADIGAGAVIIGGVELAERCVIGAGAVVTKSCETPGAVLVGVPAKPMKKSEEKEGTING